MRRELEKIDYLIGANIACTNIGSINNKHIYINMYMYKITLNF